MFDYLPRLLYPAPSCRKSLWAKETVMAGQNFDIQNPRGGDDEGYYQLQKMREVHHEIVRKRMEDPAKTQKQIAKELGISAQMVGYTLNSPIVRQKIAVMRGAADAHSYEVQEEIRSLAPLAVRTLAQIMLDNGAKNSDRRKAADSLLDRNPEASPKSEVTHKKEQLDSDTLDEIKQLGREAGVVEDVEYEDIPSPDGEEEQVSETGESSSGENT